MAYKTRNLSPGTQDSLMTKVFIPTLVTSTTAFTQSPPGTVIVQTINYTVNHLHDMEYTFTAGSGLGFTAIFEGSEDTETWTTITALSTTVTGSISDSYDYLRIRVTVSGALGSGTSMVIIGDKY
jgi:hypothetical protein